MLRQAHAQLLHVGILRQSLAAQQLSLRVPLAQHESTWSGIGVVQDAEQDSQDRPITPWVRR